MPFVERFKYLLLSILFSSSVLVSHAQNFIHYDVDNGLPSNELYNAVQDSSGFILINSKDGVIRFDGTNFRIYDVGDGLSDNDVVYSTIDAQGRVWLSPFNGTLCMYKDGKIYNAQNDSVLKKISGAFNRKEYISHGKSSIGNAIFFQLDREAEVANICIVEDDNVRIVKIEKRLHDIQQTKEGFFLFTHGNVYSYNFKTNSLKQCMNLSGVSCGIFLNNSLYALERIVGAERKLFKLSLDSSNGSIEDQILINGSKSTTSGYVVHRGGQLFFAQKSAIYQCDTNLNDLKLYHQFDRDVEVRGVLLDREGGIWAITAKHGVFLFPNNDAAQWVDDLSDPSLNFVSFDGGAGIALYNEDGILFKESQGGETYQKFKGKETNYLPFKTNDKLIYSAESFRGLERYYSFLFFDRKTKKSEKFRIDSYAGLIKCFDRQKNVLAIGTNLATAIVELPQTKIELIDQQRTTAIKIAPNNKDVFIGTLDGTYLLSKQDGSWEKNILSDSLKKHVLSLELDEFGILWVQEQNAIKAYYDGHVIYTLDVNNGLISKTINNISLSKGRLIVSTNAGVTILSYRLSPKGLVIIRIKKLNKENGLFAEYNTRATIFENELLVKTNNGIRTLNLDNIQDTRAYSPSITSFEANGKLISLDSLELNHKQKNISIDFASLIYGSQPNSYAYRLKEVAEEWQFTSGRNCSFQNLSPGEYTLQIRAVYENGTSFGKSASLSFVIKPAFWQTWWFKLLLLLLMVGAIIYLVYAFIKRRESRLESEKVLAQLKMQALKAQMNPHFIFNSLNSIQSIVNSGDVAMSNKYIVEFSQLVRQSLNYSGQDYITLEEEIGFLKNYINLEQLRFKNNFEYSIHCEESIDTQKLFLPPMFLQIYIENAIRHGVVPLGEGGQIQIYFAEEKDYLICTIDDNGVGREKSGDGKKNHHFASKGTKLNEDRIDIYKTMMGNDIHIEWLDKIDENERSNGTLVKIKIPIQ